MQEEQAVAVFAHPAGQETRVSPPPPRDMSKATRGALAPAPLPRAPLLKLQQTQQRLQKTETRAGSSTRGTSRALSKHLHLRSHHPSGQTKTKAQAFHFLLLLPTLKKIKQNPGQPQDSYFYGDHPARLLLHKDVINAIYSSANNRPLCCSVGESCGRIITEAIPAKPNSAWPHAGRAKAAISWRPGCKIKLN